MSFVNKRILFNEDQKNRFLNCEYPNESTRMTYESILKNVARFETEKNKDLCMFDYGDLKEVLIGMRKKTIKSLGVAYTIIMKYLDWCVDEKLCPVNYLKYITKDDLKTYIHQVARKKSYFNREQMYEYCDLLYNYIDKAIIALLFEGVKGRPEIHNTFEELRNLKKEDIHSEINMITLTWNPNEDGVIETRDIVVDKRTMDILVKAREEDTYYKKNGQAEGKLAEAYLKDTPYLLRSSEDSIDDKIRPATIRARFKNFRSYTGINFLNATITFQSGMLERCAIREVQKGSELKTQDFKDMWTELKLDDRQWPTLKETYKEYKTLKS